MTLEFLSVWQERPPFCTVLVLFRSYYIFEAAVLSLQVAADVVDPPKHVPSFRSLSRHLHAQCHFYDRIIFSSHHMTTPSQLNIIIVHSLGGFTGAIFS